MDRPIARRDFLKEAPAAAGLLAAGMRLPAAFGADGITVPEYRGSAVHAGRGLPDPRKALFRSHAHRRVLEAEDHDQRRSDDSVRGAADGSAGGGLSGNVLEAAIYSLETHPDRRSGAGRDARRGSQSRRGTRRSLSNNGFEVAVAWYEATGERALLDPAIKTAAALYEDFKVQQAALLGRRARRDQLPAALPRHARQEASRPGEALPRHPRARELGEPQPAQPVVHAGVAAK